MVLILSQIDQLLRRQLHDFCAFDASGVCIIFHFGLQGFGRDAQDLGNFADEMLLLNCVRQLPHDGQGHIAELALASGRTEVKLLLIAVDQPIKRILLCANSFFPKLDVLLDELVRVLARRNCNHAELRADFAGDRYGPLGSGLAGFVGIECKPDVSGEPLQCFQMLLRHSGTGRRNDLPDIRLMAGYDIEVAFNQDYVCGLTNTVFCQMQSVDMTGFIVKQSLRRIYVFRRIRDIFQQTGSKSYDRSLGVHERNHQPAAEHIP